MRQLKGKPKKETSRDKKERKQAMQEARRQITTVVLPTLAVSRDSTGLGALEEGLISS